MASIRECEECHGDFEPQYKDQIFCSDKCSSGEMPDPEWRLLGTLCSDTQESAALMKVLAVDSDIAGFLKPAHADEVLRRCNTHATLVAALRALETKIEEWAESEDSDGHTEIVNWPEMCEARRLLRPPDEHIPDRTFDEGRRAQGFKSQEHLDAFYRYYDHTQACEECQQPGEGMVLEDNSIQPTQRRCAVAQQLYREVDAAKGDAAPSVWTYNFSGGKYHIREQGNGDCIAHTYSKENAAQIVQDHARAQFLQRGAARLGALFTALVLIVCSLVIGYTCGRKGACEAPASSVTKPQSTTGVSK